MRGTEFLPVSREEMLRRNWYYYDFLVVTADAYIDHPSFGTAIIGRVLEDAGFSVGIISQPDWWNDDFAAAFLGGLSPIGTILSSYFIQHITNGGAYVDKTMYSAQISDLISALIIYLCGFVLFIRRFMNSRIAKANEKRAALEKGGDKQ